MGLRFDRIVAQFILVYLGPIEHQPKSSKRNPPFDHLLRIDGDLCLLLPINRVEVWRRVIVIVHPYDNSEKHAERGHGCPTIVLVSGAACEPSPTPRVTSGQG
jgi:hypothetical protein